jgi:hypothetical protein
VFYADPPPPIHVTVQTGSPWTWWVPVGISLLALAVSGSQYFLNRAERKRVMPSVGMHAVYVDRMNLGDPDSPFKVVSIHLENKGREATTVRNLDIYSNGGAFVNGPNCLLDDEGDPMSRDAQYETLPGFSSRRYIVDASMIQGDEVLLVAGFGHGPEIALHLPINHIGSRKPLSERKFNKIQDSWEKRKT